MMLLLLLICCLSLISSFENDLNSPDFSFRENVRRSVNIGDSAGQQHDQQQQGHQQEDQQSFTIEAIDSDYLLLNIAKSTIASAGMGVFAKKLIPKDSIICEYRGPILDVVSQSKLPYNDKFFGIRHNGQDFIILGEGVCSMINDCSNAIELLHQNSSLLNEMQDPSRCYDNLSYNSMALSMGTKIFIFSTRDILPDEEIFFPYKWTYWRKQFYVKEIMNLSSTEQIVKIT